MKKEFVLNRDINILIAGFNNNLSDMIKVHFANHIPDSRIFIFDYKEKTISPGSLSAPDYILINSDSFSFGIMDFLLHISMSYSDRVVVICMNISNDFEFEYREKIKLFLSKVNIRVLFETNIYEISDLIKGMVSGDSFYG